MPLQKSSTKDRSPEEDGNLNVTSIEWVVNPDGTQGFSWNPIVGCTNACPYCYARRIARRFSKCELCRSFTPHLHEERIRQPYDREEPATIFLGSMCDLWDKEVPLGWRLPLWGIVQSTPQHTFLVLTKQPQNFVRVEGDWFDKLDNLWLGVTVTGVDDEWRLDSLSDWRTEQAFVSFEPLLAYPDLEEVRMCVDWTIIGAQTGAGSQDKAPQLHWIQSICNATPGPIFAKDNLDWPEELGPKPRELPYLKEKKDWTSS